MTNSTDVYWDADGVSLQTYAQNISTLGGTRDGVPEWRGEDRVYAYADGAEPRDHTADSRTITLLMWVTAANADGTMPGSKRRAYTANRRAIKQLFWKPRGGLTALTKRWEHTDGSVKSATAMCRLAGNLAPDEMEGPFGARFALDLFLPDPWFYGPEVTTAVPLGVPTVITNDGDDETQRIVLTYSGQLTNALLTNATPDPDVWVKLGYALAAANTAVVDVDAETAMNTTSSTNIIGAVSNSGSRAWFALGKGANTVTLTADAGAGSASVKHRAKFF